MTTRPISQATPSDKSSGLQQYIKFRRWLLCKIPKINPQILRPSERAVLSALVARWMRLGHKATSLNITRALLVEKTGLSEQSIRRAMRRLEALSLVFPSLDWQTSGIGSDIFVHIANIAAFIDAAKNGEVHHSVLRPANGGFRGKKGDATPRNLTPPTPYNLPPTNPLQSALFPIYKERARLLNDLPRQDLGGSSVPPTGCGSVPRAALTSDKKKSGGGLP